MTTEFEDDLRDWLRGVPVSADELRQLRNLDLPVRPRIPWLSSWAAAAALVLLVGIALVVLSRPSSVGPTVNADGPVTIRTQAQPFDVCDLGGVSGTLVADATYGLALDRAGVISGAIWPFGYSARRVSGSVVLIGPSGNVVAHEGDQIVAAGAAGPDGTVEVECDLQVSSANRLGPSPTVVPTPRPSAEASIATLPNPGGTCAANQFVLGKATSGYAFGTITSSAVFVTQPLRNTGPSCLLVLPHVIGVASATGVLDVVSAEESVSRPIQIRPGQALSLEIRAEWWIADGAINPNTGSPIPAPSCNDPIRDVTRVAIPLASGSIRLDLDPVWHVVCTSPASIALSITTT